MSSSGLLYTPLVACLTGMISSVQFYPILPRKSPLFSCSASVLHCMVMESIKSPFPIHVTYQFDALDTGKTLASIRVQGTARTFYGLVDFLMAPMVKRNLQKV